MTEADDRLGPSVAVLLAAGTGSRLRPITYAVPKELFPLGRRTIMDYIVDDLIAGGYTHILVVTSQGKPAIARYLEAHLIPACETRGTQVSTVLQQWPGTGGAVVSALETLPPSEVLVVWGDEVFWPPTRALEVTKHFAASGVTTIATTTVTDEAVPRCGIVEWVRKPAALGGSGRITQLHEKPDPLEVKSRSASVGGQLLSIEFSQYLRFSVAAQLHAGAKEASLALALGNFLGNGGAVDGVALGCAWLDTGSWDGYSRAFAQAEKQWSLKETES